MPGWFPRRSHSGPHGEHQMSPHLWRMPFKTLGEIGAAGPRADKEQVRLLNLQGREIDLVEEEAWPARITGRPLEESQPRGLLAVIADKHPRPGSQQCNNGCARAGGE